MAPNNSYTMRNMNRPMTSKHWSCSIQLFVTGEDASNRKKELCHRCECLGISGVVTNLGNVTTLWLKKLDFFEEALCHPILVLQLLFKQRWWSRYVVFVGNEKGRKMDDWKYRLSDWGQICRLVVVFIVVLHNENDLISLRLSKHWGQPSEQPRHAQLDLKVQWWSGDFHCRVWLLKVSVGMSWTIEKFN